jgi:hypothetical protein
MQGDALSLHDAVQRRIANTKPFADLRRGRAGLAVQTRDLERLVLTQSAATPAVF